MENKKTKEELTKADIIDMELYDFFDLLAKSNVNDVFVIKGVLENATREVLGLANQYKKEMFDFTEETFDNAKFDEKMTYMVHCFAMAMYLDKKVELCSRRIQDLTPDCFKK